MEISSHGKNSARASAEPRKEGDTFAPVVRFRAPTPFSPCLQWRVFPPVLTRGAHPHWPCLRSPNRSRRFCQVGKGTHPLASCWRYWRRWRGVKLKPCGSESNQDLLRQKEGVSHSDARRGQLLAARFFSKSTKIYCAN